MFQQQSQWDLETKWTIIASKAASIIHCDGELSFQTRNYLYDMCYSLPRITTANSVINAPENTLVWKDKKLPLISYTFKDINVHFFDWGGDIKSLDVQSCGILECLIGEGMVYIYLMKIANNL